MAHIKLFLQIYILSLLDLCRGQDFEDGCITCICNSYTQCTSLKNCARETINDYYWYESMNSNIDRNNETYEGCMEDDDCILRTIRDFINIHGYVDCNGDKKMDCRDYAAIHLSKSDACQNYPFPRGYTFRLNGCIVRRFGGNLVMKQPSVPGREPEIV